MEKHFTLDLKPTDKGRKLPKKEVLDFLFAYSKSIECIHTEGIRDAFVSKN